MKDKIVEILKDLAYSVMVAEPTHIKDLDDLGFEIYKRKIAQIYSAGEEVVEFDCPECGERLKYGFSPETLKKIKQSRLFTRPTVSEGEIKAFMKYMYDLGVDKFEITNLDSTIDDLLKNGIATAKD